MVLPVGCNHDVVYPPPHPTLTSSTPRFVTRYATYNGWTKYDDYMDNSRDTTQLWSATRSGRPVPLEYTRPANDGIQLTNHERGSYMLVDPEDGLSAASVSSNQGKFYTQSRHPSTESRDPKACESTFEIYRADDSN